MARQRTPPTPTGHTILVVDDNQEYLVAAERLLTRCGHSVVAMENPAEALALLRHARFDLVLVDFFMPEMTGEAFVAELRTWNPLVQVLLQTGYASEMPPRELVRRLDIQGYYDKGEGPDKLLLLADVALKAARVIQRLDKERCAQRVILEAALDLHRAAPEEDELFRRIARRMGALLEVLASFGPDTSPERPAGVFVATGPDAGALVVRAGTGRFGEVARTLEGLGADGLVALAGALSEATARTGDFGTIVPLVEAGAPLGAIFAEQRAADAADVALLRTFADHAASAILRLHAAEPGASGGDATRRAPAGSIGVGDAA